MAAHSTPLKDDAFVIWAASWFADPFYDFLDGTSWTDIAPWLRYAGLTMISSLIMAYLARKKGFNLLRAPSRVLWLTSVLLALLSAGSAIPKHVKAMLICIMGIVLTPIFFIIGSAYVFSGSEPGDSDAPEGTEGRQAQDEPGAGASSVALADEPKKTI